MAARRAERLVNLVIALLWTRQYLTAERIRDAVPGYEANDGTDRADEAFKRMFERDKAELRDLGIPLETGRTSIADVEDGYRISRRDYELPPVDFDPGEAAAVGLAARLWQSATLAAPARTALMKLRAGGTELDPDAALAPTPQIDASDPALGPLLGAVRARQVVRFGYAAANSPNATRPVMRTVEPWGVLSWRRRWYLVGFDVDRGAPRSFRLSRVDGGVVVTRAVPGAERPQELDLVAMVAGRPEQRRLARVQLLPGRAARLRRLAQPSGAASSGADGSGAPSGAGEVASGASEVAGAGGGDVLDIEFGDTAWLAREVAAAGAGALVLDPPELVEAVRAILTGSADAPAGAPVGGSI